MGICAIKKQVRGVAFLLNYMCARIRIANRTPAKGVLLNNAKE